MKVLAKSLIMVIGTVGCAKIDFKNPTVNGDTPVTEEPEIPETPEEPTPTEPTPPTTDGGDEGTNESTGGDEGTNEGGGDDGTNEGGGDDGTNENGDGDDGQTNENDDSNGVGTKTVIDCETTYERVKVDSVNDKLDKILSSLESNEGLSLHGGHYYKTGGHYYKKRHGHYSGHDKKLKISKDCTITKVPYEEPSEADQQ